MIIYLDENLPMHLAEGFQIIQAPENLKSGYDISVAHITSVFSKGIKDEEWIPKLKAQRACVITQDLNIQRRQHELTLYRQYELGMLFLRGPSKKQGMSVWQIVQTLAKHWLEITRIAMEEQRPFAFQVTLTRKIKRLNGV